MPLIRCLNCGLPLKKMPYDRPSDRKTQRPKWGWRHIFQYHEGHKLPCRRAIPEYVIDNEEIRSQGKIWKEQFKGERPYIKRKRRKAKLPRR